MTLLARPRLLAAPSRGRTALWLAAVAALVAALTAAPATPASAAAPEFPYSFTASSSGNILSVPGTQKSFTLAAGEAVYLSTRNVSNTLLTSLRSIDNPGTTFLLSCWKAGESATNQNGVYSGQNTDTPTETTVAGYMRWLLVAPTAGTYTCELQVSSYARADTITYAGGRIHMRVNAGAEILHSYVGPTEVVQSAVHWAMPNVPRESEYVLWSGIKQLNGYTVPITPGTDTMTIVQDVNITTCIAGDSGTWPACAGGSGGSTMRTWIDAQPQYANGTACGPLIKGPVRSTWISPDRHHKPVTDTLVIPRSSIGAGCTHVRTSLKVEHGGGAQAVLHAHWAGATGGNRPTYGVAYQH
ncbi:hypothetical protein [Jiangella rhizosphaerae]|uniref:hypothetical protein n=1 Tax=Jiangella rhizosphaerae TaxID=2293569 RepID=UPI0011C3A325|nr:hypothetical protein [Jiangella rhizosphaerae]